MTTLSSVDTKNDAGLKEAQVLTATMRHHQQALRDLGARRKGLILRLRAERWTYKEIAKALGVSEQLIYKIIQDDLNRIPIFDSEGNPIRHRGRPALSQEERVARAQARVDKMRKNKEPVSV